MNLMFSFSLYTCLLYVLHPLTLSVDWTNSQQTCNNPLKFIGKSFLKHVKQWINLISLINTSKVVHDNELQDSKATFILQFKMWNKHSNFPNSSCNSRFHRPSRCYHKIIKGAMNVDTMAHWRANHPVLLKESEMSL